MQHRSQLVMLLHTPACIPGPIRHAIPCMAVAQHQPWCCQEQLLGTFQHSQQGGGQAGRLHNRDGLQPHTGTGIAGQVQRPKRGAAAATALLPC